MGKKMVLRHKASSCQLEPQQMELEHKKGTDFSLTEKKYVEFFDFLKELHLTAGLERQPQQTQEASLNIITSSLVSFFNHAKVYTSRQLECSTICLANLLSVLGSNISQLTLGREFVLKLRRFGSELAEDTLQVGYQQKVQALLYILVMLIYKEKAGQVCPIKQLNKLIWSDRVLVSSLLRLRLPKDRRISKFYGIAIVYLSNRKNNPKLKKLIVSSIFNNFQYIQHETTRLNLLVYLRNEKNKVTLNLRDISEGKIVQQLVAAYPLHIHEYQSYYILDYLHHLLILFPSLAVQVASSSFLPYLLETAGPTNLHHPLHESTIISFTQSTLKYLQPSSKQHLIESITTIHPFNQYIAIKLVQMLVDHELDCCQLLTLAHKGYFENLLNVVMRQEEEGVKKRAAEQYLKVVDKIQGSNAATAGYLLSKLQNKVNRSNVHWLQNMLQTHNSQQLCSNILMM